MEACSADPNFVTLSANWPSQIIADGLCFLSYPPGWSLSGDGSAAWAEGSGAGYAVLTPLLPGAGWTAATELQQALGMLRRRFPDLRILKQWELPLPGEMAVAGLHSLAAGFSLTYRGAPAVGLLLLSYIPCEPLSPFCTMQAQATWSRVDRLSENACVLAAINASYHCPHSGGAGCDTSDCNVSCQEQGYARGRCGGDRCYCLGWGG